MLLRFLALWETLPIERHITPREWQLVGTVDDLLPMPFSSRANAEK